MNQQAYSLVDRLGALNNEIITFVEQNADKHWQTVCSEDWTLGVVAHHIGASHYPAVIEMTKMIVAGQPLPEITPDALVQMANEHAKEHADCTKEEVLGALRKNGAMLREYTAGLNDDDLNCKTHMEILGGEISAGQFMEALILQSAGEHFTSMKKAVGQT